MSEKLISLKNLQEYDEFLDIKLEQIETNITTNKNDLQGQINNKVDKITGKDLSTNDYTTTEKEKLAGIAAGANKTVVDSSLSSTSTNPVQNKAVKAALDTKANKTDVYTKTETDNKIANKIAEIVADAPEEFDTLKEMSDWISGHEDSAAAMNAAIQTNANNISALQTSKADSSLLNDYLPLTGGEVTGTLVLSKTTDASGTANNSPALIVGGTATSAHVEIDNNEVQAKSDGTTPTKLILNADGGLVAIGSGGLSSNGNITAPGFSGPLTGNASTANKLATVRKINNVLFDGSDDIKIRLDTYVVSDSSSSWSTAPWHKVASCETTSRVTTRALTLYVERTLHPRAGGSGILRAIIRSGSTAGSVGHVYLDWEYANSEINTDNFVLVYNADETTGKLTAELWMKITAQYETWQFKVLSMGETTTADSPVWTLYNLSSGAENYSEGTGVKVSSLMGIKNNEDEINALKTGKVDKVDGKGLSTNDYTTTEKNKLAGIATGANKTVVDSSLKSTSTNPVQNKVVKAALDAKADSSLLNNYLPLTGGEVTGPLKATYFSSDGSNLLASGIVEMKSPYVSIAFPDIDNYSSVYLCIANDYVGKTAGIVPIQYLLAKTSNYIDLLGSCVYETILSGCSTRVKATSGTGFIIYPFSVYNKGTDDNIGVGYNLGYEIYKI